jgi:adenylate cyclase
MSLIAGVITLAAWRFHTQGELWDVVWPTVTATLVGAAISGWRYLVEIRHRRRAWSLFATYVPAAVVAELATRDRLEDATRSARRPISVVFCDLRGFTPIAADTRSGRRPAAPRALLRVRRRDRPSQRAARSCSSSATRCSPCSGHPSTNQVPPPRRPVRDRAAGRRARSSTPGSIAQGLPRIRFGIGVHRGLATTAHVGTHDRRQYSAIGDTVNVGSRLCGAARAGEIVASTDAVETVRPEAMLGLEPDGAIELKGVAAAVRVLRRAAPCG